MVLPNDLLVASEITKSYSPVGRVELLTLILKSTVDQTGLLGSVQQDGIEPAAVDGVDCLSGTAVLLNNCGAVGAMNLAGVLRIGVLEGRFGKADTFKVRRPR